VAVLPEAEEIEVAINPDDIKMDFFRSGGAGGQNVNKVKMRIQQPQRRRNSLWRAKKIRNSCNRSRTI